MHRMGWCCAAVVLLVGGAVRTRAQTTVFRADMEQCAVDTAPTARVGVISILQGNAAAFRVRPTESGFPTKHLLIDGSVDEDKSLACRLAETNRNRSMLLQWQMSLSSYPTGAGSLTLTCNFRLDTADYTFSVRWRTNGTIEVYRPALSSHAVLLDAYATNTVSTYSLGFDNDARHVTFRKDGAVLATYDAFCQRGRVLHEYVFSVDHRVDGDVRIDNISVDQIDGGIVNLNAGFEDYARGDLQTGGLEGFPAADRVFQSYATGTSSNTVETNGFGGTVRHLNIADNNPSDYSQVRFALNTPITNGTLYWTFHAQSPLSAAWRVTLDGSTNESSEPLAILTFDDDGWVYGQDADTPQRICRYRWDQPIPVSLWVDLENDTWGGWVAASGTTYQVDSYALADTGRGIEAMTVRSLTGANHTDTGTFLIDEISVSRRSRRSLFLIDNNMPVAARIEQHSLVHRGVTNVFAQVLDPLSLAFGEDGALCVVEGITKSVVAFDPYTCKPLWTANPLTMQGPTAVAVDRHFAMYVGDTNAEAVFVFEPVTHALQGVFGETTNLTDRHIRAMHFDREGNLYVGGWASGLTYLLKYDSRGTYLRNYLAITANVTGFWDFALSPSGTIYVADSIADDVKMFDPESGLYLGVFGRTGFLCSQVNAITFLPNGNLVVADSGNNSIMEFEPETGDEIGNWEPGPAGLSSALCMAVPDMCSIASIQPAGDGAQLKVIGERGRFYDVMAATDLVQPAWSPAPSNQVAAGAVPTLTHPGATAPHEVFVVRESLTDH